MTLTDLLADSYRRLGFASSPATEVSTRITAYLNEAHRQLLGMPGMELLRRSTYSFASVANTQQYGLPLSVGRVLSVRDTTNDVDLQPMSWGRYRAEAPDPSASPGTSHSYVPVGYTQVATQPSDASKIYVDSTSASDTGTVYIEGIRTGGYPFTASQTMTGTTAVQIGTLADILTITKCYLSASAVGTVTIHEDADGGTTLATIPIGRKYARYWTLALYPTPSAAVTYYMDFEREVSDMAQATDEPLLPPDYHWLLGTGARMREYEKQEDTRYALALREWQTGVRDLKWWLATQQGIVVSRHRGRAPSQLGAWYPAGS
jgi:hypothetical protein